MTIRIERRHFFMIGVISLLLLAERFSSDFPFPDVIPRHDDAPISVNGLHILMLYNAERQDKLTPDQHSIIESAQGAGKLRIWLDASAPDNWRLIDMEENIDDSEPWIKEAMALHPDNVIPWILVANSSSGYKGEFPEGDEDDLVKFLEEYK